MYKALKISSIILGIGCIFLLLSHLGVQYTSYTLTDDAKINLLTDDTVEITDHIGYTKIVPATTGGHLIYYPGGLVQPKSYLPQAIEFSQEKNTTVYILHPPFNLAILGIWMADRVKYREGFEQSWVGGHSLGGIAACRYTADHYSTTSGLILHGSYCDQDMNSFSGEVVSVIGLKDTILDRTNYQQAKGNLSPQKQFYEILEGNHSMFGSYGLQQGDTPSTILHSWLITK